MAALFTYEYVYDWRLRSTLFRLQIGTPQFLRLSWQARLNELIWFLVALLLGLLAILTTKWALVALAIGLALWKGVMFISHFLSLRLALFSLRESFRAKPAKTIKLVVSDDGLHETDGQIESFAPWASVESFVQHEDFLGIKLKSDQWALILTSTLSPTSPPIETLVSHLEERKIPRSSYKNAPAFTVV